MLDQLFLNGALGPLFDFVEFLIQHRKGRNFIGPFSEAFVSAKSPYRIFNAQIGAIGTEHQAEAVIAAIEHSEVAPAARAHLVASSAALRSGEWAASVRESIHAVESMVSRLAPGKDKLAAGLAELERAGHLHGSLKAAFASLYGYTSDEEGVRHALIFSDEAKVDEADALFMLGACASFVTYAIARGRAMGAIS